MELTGPAPAVLLQMVSMTTHLPLTTSNRWDHSNWRRLMGGRGNLFRENLDSDYSFSACKF